MPSSAVPVGSDCTGTRGSFADANGSAFLIDVRLAVDRFEAVAHGDARAVFTWIARCRCPRDPVGAGGRREQILIAVGTADAGTSAAACANLPWSTRMRALRSATPANEDAPEPSVCLLSREARCRGARTRCRTPARSSAVRRGRPAVDRVTERNAVAVVLGQRHLEEAKAHLQLADERRAVLEYWFIASSASRTIAALLRDRRVRNVAVVRR